VILQERWQSIKGKEKEIMASEMTKKHGNGQTAVAERTRNTVTFTPRFDIVENGDELVLYGDLPE